jgi:hypothetical protein
MQLLHRESKPVLDLGIEPRLQLKVNGAMLE